jgi:NADH-quinone oxidoreductase subunit E
MSVHGYSSLITWYREMLSEEERTEIQAEMQHYGDAQAASIEALKVVQKHRGWVTDEGLKDVGEFLGMTEAELDGVATFYNLVFRKPVGRHIIFVCSSVSCWVMGYESVREYLATKLQIGLGETTGDGRFTLLPIACLGACDRAPAMMVDNDLHGGLTSQGIDAILEQYV